MNGQASQGGHFAKWHIEPRQEEEQEAWLLTYLDMLTLLLVMLVVMLALAGKGDGQSNQTAATDSSVQTFGDISLEPATPAQPIPPIVAEAAMNTPAEADTHDTPTMDLGKDIEVIVNDGSISFRISSEILFGSGQAELENAGLDVIDRLIPTLAANHYRILVEGHTDNLPIQTERFPSNWELSASRASSVVRYLQLAGIDATRMSATGYADTRPLGDNASDQGRASNRRVELIMQTQPDKP
ncbi:flagellar motor protein MotB [Pseudomonas sp. BAY1663]|uniref:OmpA/MotB family protein n=1 Tax=Pseudomonas sp. BAY1663 TaxID=1439940 RepID=UPI00042E1395|nr:OmpA family protein [Pseudomonas sp. BAY1663]EXF42656.1 flagellar motor protein MotB [Pseudomonas sp. BAY1663]